jgi:hypothetical protein
MAAELNRYNFLRWHNACDDIDPLTLPRFYVKDNAYSTPILKVGEATYFYLNFNVQVDYDFDVFLMKDNVKVGSALCSLTQLVIDTEVYEYYGNFTTPNVDDGFYRLGLYSGSDLMALSNVVEVISNPLNSVLVRFRHVKDTYLFNYSLLPSDWYQQFRLRITEADKQVQDNHDQYRSVTTNKLRNYDAKVDRYVKFETYFFDAGMHEAMEVMVSHDVIYINSKKFTFKEAYKRTVDASSKVSKGEFELWEDQFSQDQKFDNTNVVTLAVIYYNTEQSQTFQKNNCPPGYMGTMVAYTVQAGKYCSMVSQEAANAVALLEISDNGQDYANEHGSCTDMVFYNTIQSQGFVKNNCATGYHGSTVVYTVVAGTYSSPVSQVAADNLALADIALNGQAYANAHGSCSAYPKNIIIDYIHINGVLVEDFDNWSGGMPVGWSQIYSSVLTVVNNSDRLDLTVNTNPGLYLTGIRRNIGDYGTANATLQIEIKIDSLDIDSSFVFDLMNLETLETSSHILHNGINTLNLTRGIHYQTGWELIAVSNFKYYD